MAIELVLLLERFLLGEVEKTGYYEMTKSLVKEVHAKLLEIVLLLARVLLGD
jgi:hypothetical protein